MEVDVRPAGRDHAMLSSPISSALSDHSQTEKDCIPPPRLSSTFLDDAKEGAKAVQAASGATTSAKSVSDATAKPRKKRVAVANEINGDGKPEIQKKTRKPRDPSQPSRKKQKLSNDLVPTHTVSFSGLTVSEPLHLHNTNGVSGNAASNKPSVPRVNSLQQVSRPPSSGQKYDPIRSSYNNYPTATADGSPGHARSTPSIASLIDPTPPPTLTHPLSRPPTSTSRHLDAHSNTVRSTTTTEQGHSSVSVPLTTPDSTKDRARDVAQSGDVEIYCAGRSVTPQQSAQAVSPAHGPAPKPPRQKEPLPPLPLGNGLRSGAAFGKNEPIEHEYPEVPNQCIVIEVPMNKETGNYVNFMKEVEQKYGFDVAHPRLAEHRKRMRQVAAAGAALESGSGSADDMPIDVSEVESNVEMGGVDNDSAAVDGKKKRRTRDNAYDKEDDFIDDTELVWEEQALASRDGYFVWSGPLVPEGDKPSVERADGSVKRGRGRGKVGTTRGETSSRGRGSGVVRASRGGTAVRKPRQTKAERVKLESEKQERLKTTPTASDPSSYPGISA